MIEHQDQDRISFNCEPDHIVTKLEYAFLGVKHEYKTQCADGESNKIVWDKKETATAWIFNTYRVRNHFVPNPTNPKLKRLEIEKI